MKILNEASAPIIVYQGNIPCFNSNTTPFVKTISNIIPATKQRPSENQSKAHKNTNIATERTMQPQRKAFE